MVPKSGRSSRNNLCKIYFRRRNTIRKTKWIWIDWTARAHIFSCTICVNISIVLIAWQEWSGVQRKLSDQKYIFVIQSSLFHNLFKKTKEILLFLFTKSESIAHASNSWVGRAREKRRTTCVFQIITLRNSYVWTVIILPYFYIIRSVRSCEECFVAVIFISGYILHIVESCMNFNSYR